MAIKTLTLTQLYEKLRINEYSFFLDENTIRSESQNGHIITAVRGNRRWRGSITLTPNKPSEHRLVNSLVAQIQDSETYFEMTDYWSRYPYADPNGTKLGSNVVSVSGATAGSFTVDATGFPANYVLTAGDRFSFYTGGIHFLHELSSDVTATSTGTATLALLNPLRAGVPSTMNLTWKKPRCTAKFVPGSMKSVSFEPGVVSGFSFDWIQVFVKK